MASNYERIKNTKDLNEFRDAVDMEMVPTSVRYDWRLNVDHHRSAAFLDVGIVFAQAGQTFEERT